MKYLVLAFAVIISGLLLGCPLPEEQARKTVLETYPRSSIIYAEEEGYIGHYYICQQGIVIYVRTNRSENVKITILKNLVLNADIVHCGE